ncbi:hypothetical protein BO94DRAFT_462274 [Aspergillus sclerotioniger CBS 115572]|uniref:Uncharacterized protein n=1 Tax=Aspergillus sclerotioniger CBS 115572 TaxID=1450535 RepID=A0A317X1V2_9EURO|nr:hypothetical protein BO94DRAFT_462274 [Aspergillus sclerotioniger CBS 115572]PWY91582.1 hypothetical protein BO94DRAFT_462274 [Aspergillus sclerotioniger CBS 115572]
MHFFHYHASSTARRRQIIQVRDNVLKSLNETFDLVTRSRKESFDDDAYLALPIKCQELRISPSRTHVDSPSPVFFDPLGVEGVLSPHPTDAETREHLQKINQEWGRKETMRLTVGDKAFDLMYAIEDFFRIYQRDMGPGNPSVSLMQHANWVPSDDIFADEFDDILYEGRWGQPYAAWKARKALNTPHTMIAILNETEEDDRLLIREVQTILAAMISRLRSDDFPSHTIIPVMAITTFATYKLRIIETHYSLEGLIFRESQLLSFTEKDIAIHNMNILMTFMAARMIGDTESLSIMGEVCL